MKNIPGLSKNVYKGLCVEVGTSTEVRFRREVIDTTEDLQGNLFLEKGCKKSTLSGSYREGFRLKTSDIDIMRWSLSDKVICNPSQISLYRNPQHTVILMECDDLPPGFTRLKLIVVPGHHFHEILCSVEVDDGQYISNSLFIKSASQIAELLDFFETFQHRPSLSVASASLEMSFVFCFKSDHWPDTAETWINRCQQTGWPVETVVSEIVNSGFYVVPIGSTSDEHLEWRISFSSAEQKIMYSLNHCQFICYGILKIFLKEVINAQSSSPVLCSYFMKTVLFWVIQNDRTLKWTPDNLLCCFWNCFKLLIHWVNTGCCPNFFIPQNNMFRLKVIGHTQAALFDQLYEFYVDGIWCLFFSPTIKPYFCDAIINENVSFMQEINSPRKEDHVFNELKILQNILLPSTKINIKTAFVLMNRIERFLRGNMTKYQRVILQLLTTRIMRLTGISLTVAQKKMCRKQTYLARKFACSMLKFSSAIGGLSEVLYLAMFYYGNGQYEQSLRCTQRARPYPDKVKSFSAMMRKSSIDNIDLLNADLFFSELVIEQKANEDIYGKCGQLHIPYEVMLHMLLILNYHKLGDRVMSQQSLQDLHTLMHCGKMPYEVSTVSRKICPKIRAKLSIDENLYKYELYADISWQILGICQHVCGNTLEALNSYQRSLESKSFNGIQRATFLRMLLSLFVLTQSRSKYSDG